MARDPELIKQRNEAIKKRFKVITRKNPQWRLDSILEQLQTEFHLTKGYIQKILTDNV